MVMIGPPTEKEKKCPIRASRVDWDRVLSFVFALTACVLMVAVGVGIGMKVARYMDGRDSVLVFVNTGEDGLVGEDAMQGPSQGKWTQVRIERSSGIIPSRTSSGDASKAPTVVEFKEANAREIFGDDTRAISFLFLSKSSASKFDQMLREYQHAADELQGERVVFSYVDVDSEEAARLIDFFALTRDEFPTIRMHAIQDGKMLKFKPSTDIAKLRSSDVVDFARSVLSGALNPYYRSEVAPSDWDKGTVKVLTGENFDRVVKSGGSKHVFVEFYATWCGHCVKLAPIWEKLAEKYKDHENVVIAKMDAIANELPDLQVRAFPTIKLFPAGVSGDAHRQGVDYNGPRTVEGFSKFLDSYVNKVTADDI